MKPAVVYSLLATAFLFILAFAPKPERGQYSQLRLGRCLGCKHLIFDPLVAKIERSLEEESWSEKDQHDLENYYKSQIKHDWDTNPFSDIPEEDPEDYFSEKGQLNIPGRLLILFPCLDKTPKDGVISFKELEAWNVWQATNRLNQRTLREMKEHDLDGDKFITLKEYLPNLFDNDNIDMNDKTHGKPGWWSEQFTNADIDGNGRLNFTEFNDFLHPEDSGNESIQQWMVKEKIQGMDYDKDGKLNFIEFNERAYDVYKNYIEFENDGNNLPSAEEKFAELDVNMDKYLTVAELRPLTHHLNPGELSYARYFTKYLIQMADDDRDGTLSLNEMLNHPHIFYSTVIHESELTDDDYTHEELR
ncbi:hypothetical protein MKW98_001756 [Papaver atlanticum]|uniref:EF-hand domain-containing protein n=1 Tax=Papaver atlanticum TaxID=357466 RepID=A0AAD4S690_9MAGN|nr:hypothetical protein MKW98_001756 [Papaver atlanticum]